MADTDSRAGTRYDDAAIRDYVHRVHAPHDAALDAAFRASEWADIPAIQLGQSEGRLLEILLRMVGARRVVEVGTLAGYSAIRCARAIGPTGRLWTVEVDPRHAEVARANLQRAGLADRVDVLLGPALEVLPTLERQAPFDAVFIDADKVNYDRYGAWAVANLRRGGIVLGDNAFLFGELLDDSDRGRAMRAFHELVARDCDSVCIPTPDGLVLGIKR
jgi:caffeoyl-CoA O-methyltransferase